MNEPLTINLDLQLRSLHEESKYAFSFHRWKWTQCFVYDKLLAPCFPLIFPDKRHTMGLSSASIPPSFSLSLSLSLSHTVSLSLCLSLALSPPDVRYSGRVCAAGCRLTLFKTMITSFRLVLQLSTPGAPTAGTPTDHSTHTQTTTTHTHTHTHTHARTHTHAMQYGLKKQPQGWVIKQKTMTPYITFHKVSH